MSDRLLRTAVPLLLTLGTGCLGGAAPAPDPDPARPADGRPTGPPEPAAGPPARVGTDGGTARTAPAAPSGPVAEEERVLRHRAKAAIDEGDYLAARDAIEAALTAPAVAEARALLANGDAESALAVLEGALALTPGRPEVLLAHADASLIVGKRGPDPALCELALRSYLQSGRSARALLGASRAARALGRTDEALRHARAGVALAAELDEDARAALAERPRRTLAEATFDAYMAMRRDGTEPGTLFQDAEDAVLALMRNEADDPWVWTQLANLYLTSGRHHDAQSALERGLARLPDDRGLPGLLVQAARANGGSDEVVASFERFTARNPDAALGAWYLGSELLERSLARLDECPADTLARAEAEFRRCREAEDEYARSCLGNEVTCRTATGWCRLRAGKLEAAQRAFESTEELFEGGILHSTRDRVPPAFDGLAEVARAWAGRDELERAAGAFATLHRIAPDEPEWARETGRYHLAAGERMRLVAEDCRLAAERGETAPARALELVRVAGLDAPADATDALPRAAVRADERAAALFETSYTAQRAAAQLSPEDVRCLTDAATVAVVHLDRDHEEAKRLLLRAVELGRGQLADPDLDEERRRELTEAWGDAHQTLGILLLEHEGDPEAARTWFERSVEIGPLPRPSVTEIYLPRCAAPANAPGE